jgi:hypothetical protein
MVHLTYMRDLMRREIIEDKRRRENETPGKVKAAS